MYNRFLSFCRESYTKWFQTIWCKSQFAALKLYFCKLFKSKFWTMRGYCKLFKRIKMTVNFFWTQFLLEKFILLGKFDNTSFSGQNNVCTYLKCKKLSKTCNNFTPGWHCFIEIWFSNPVNSRMLIQGSQKPRKLGKPWKAIFELT